MKNGIKILALLSLVTFQLTATIKLIGFNNDSDFKFKCCLEDGRCLKKSFQNDGGILIDGKGAILSTKDESLKIRFEDSGKSGFHRPHWKYNVWVDSDQAHPITGENSFLFAMIFYDGNGEFTLNFSEDGHISLEKGKDVKDILYPWKATAFGRSNPYMMIENIEFDDRGVYYFDKDGCVKRVWQTFFYDSEDRCSEESWQERTLGQTDEWEKRKCSILGRDDI